MSERMTGSFEGVDELKALLRTVGTGWKRVAARRMYRWASHVIGLAKALAPVDLGTMRDSGFVELPIIDGKKGPPVVDGNADEVVTAEQGAPGSVVVPFGFGGESEDYVIIQHEDVTLRHEVGQAKFFETPVASEAPTLAGEIVADLKAWLGRISPSGPKTPGNVPIEGEIRNAAGDVWVRGYTKDDGSRVGGYWRRRARKG